VDCTAGLCGLEEVDTGGGPELSHVPGSDLCQLCDPDRKESKSPFLCLNRIEEMVAYRSGNRAL